jgi:hypothetical protein
MLIFLKISIPLIHITYFVKVKYCFKTFIPLILYDRSLSIGNRVINKSAYYISVSNRWMLLAPCRQRI